MVRTLILCIPVAACVAYRAQPVSLPDVARRIDARSAGRLDFDAALALAVERDPGLAALRAEARAAGHEVPGTDAETVWRIGDEEIEATADPLALASIGPRGAAKRVARARREEALLRVREAEYELAARLAEIYAVEAALDARAPLEVDADPEAFLAAGLASEVAAAMLRAAKEAEASERRRVEALRKENAARLRALLGVGPGAALALVPPAEGFPDAPDRLLDRPDLALAVARYRTADAEFRRAVVEQYPSLAAGPEIALRAGEVSGLVELKIPIGASRSARAASERREARRAEVEAALLAARRDAEEGAAAFEAAAARARAASASASAMASAFRAAKARLEVEPDAFEAMADLAGRAVAESAMAREAAVEAAQARVRLARARGWPAREEAAR
jgi:cobalt-zinc-cadmium efflux system outer membrane protein